jgi:hypothetical protein
MYSAFLSSFFRCSTALIVFAALGCGDEATYSDQHLSQIRYDCEQTAPCDPVFSVTKDPIDECIADTGKKLDTGSEAVRVNYETRFNRCAASSGCTYFACAQDAMLFSIVKEQLIRNDCQHAFACKVMRGEPVLANEAEVCFQTVAQRIDFASLPEKAAYEMRATRCAALVGCDYVACQ